MCIVSGLRLGCQLSFPHVREDVDHYAIHGQSCKWSLGRHSRHGVINDIIHGSLILAKMPSRLEPTYLLQSEQQGLRLLPPISIILFYTNGSGDVWYFQAQNAGTFE